MQPNNFPVRFVKRVDRNFNFKLFFLYYFLHCVPAIYTQKAHLVKLRMLRLVIGNPRFGRAVVSQQQLLLTHKLSPTFYLCNMSAQSSSHTSASTSSVAKPSSLTGDSKPLAVKAEDPIKFVAQSRSVHIYRPDQMSHQDVMASSQAVLSPISTTTTAPGVVVIMGWMDAPLRIVTKYAAPYAKLFPQATIVIKLSTGKSFMASKEAREASLMTVVKVLEEVNNKSNGLLLHSCEFSFYISKRDTGDLLIDKPCSL